MALIVFDLDGTLADSLPDITRALNLALAEDGLPTIDRAVVRTMIGDGILSLATKAVAHVQASSDPSHIARRIAREYDDHPCVESTLFPQIAEVLRTLRASPDHKLAVLTNKLGRVARPMLSILGIADEFDLIIGDNDGYPRKPDPAAITALIEKFGCRREQTFMVGDGIPDMNVAKNAGITGVAALWGYTPKERLQAEGASVALNAPIDLLQLIRAATASR
jgi:phosphoglycolate phosphatase